MFIRQNGWNLLKAQSEGIALIQFTYGGHFAATVQKGWNILSIPSEFSGYAVVSLLKAGLPPGNMSAGLGGSPMIPLSDQDELKPDENDIGSMFEPDNGRMRKDGDPFLFSEGLKEALNPGKG